jgi:hypothetical protein
MEHFTATYTDPTDLSLYGDLTVTNGVITDIKNGGGVSVNVPFTITSLKCGYADYGSPNCDLPLNENGATFGTDNAGDMNLFAYMSGFYVDESRYDPTGGDLNAIIPVAFTVTPTGVPEPASWALMLTGFALAGSALRGKTRTSVH